MREAEAWLSAIRARGADLHGTAELEGLQWAVMLLTGRGQLGGPYDADQQFGPSSLDGTHRLQDLAHLPRSDQFGRAERLVRSDARTEEFFEGRGIPFSSTEDARLRFVAQPGTTHSGIVNARMPGMLRGNREPDRARRRALGRES